MYTKVELLREVVPIKPRTLEEKQRIEEFLKRGRALFPTGQYIFQPTEKNKTLDRKYNLRNKDKVEIMKTLQADDCVDIKQNDNPRYPDADLFVFQKTVELESYGEKETVELYIKDYIWMCQDRMERVIILSFHEEGLYD